MAKRESLSAAKEAKQDEFYTQLSDIEKEMRYYKKHFKDKVVLCNCDDPFESKFFEYFVKKFNSLGLKKLIATCYAGSPIAGSQLSLFDVDKTAEPGTPYKAVVTQVYDKTGDGYVDMFDVKELFLSGENKLSKLEGDGDFRSDECLELLDEVDIVVTNPPFSLFREYLTLLIEKDKQFIIIGNSNAVSYKEVFPLIQSNKLWLGVTRQGTGSMWFRVPDDFPEKTGQKIEDGIRYQTIGNSAWFTNMDYPRRHEDVILYKRYTPEEYPHYDNYDAININKVTEIPCDYDGVMGVPITFLGKYNPDQFEIIGIAKAGAGDPALKTKTYPKQTQIAKDGSRKENVSKLNDGPAIKVEQPPKGKTYYMIGDDVFVQEYARILIRNLHPEEPRN